MPQQEEARCPPPLPDLLTLTQHKPWTCADTHVRPTCLPRVCQKHRPVLHSREGEGAAPSDEVCDHKTSLLLCEALPNALQETQQHTVLGPQVGFWMWAINLLEKKYFIKKLDCMARGVADKHMKSERRWFTLLLP